MKSESKSIYLQCIRSLIKERNNGNSSPTCKQEGVSLPNLDEIARLQFEPRNQDNCIHPNTIGMLYHWTRPELVNKILKNGLVPRSKNSFFSYPERIYVVKDSIPQTELMDLGSMLSTSLNFEKYENGQSFEQTLSLIQIDPKRLKQDFAFFIDPNYSDYGLYCLENIPPYAIEYKANKTFSFIGNN